MSLNYLRNHIYKLMKAMRHKSGRFVLYREHNKTLFNVLAKLGLFDFYATNKGHMINRSQIIAFLFCGGYEAYQHGHTACKDYIEVHHIDGIVDNDTESNLVYLSKQDHAFVSGCTYTPMFGRMPSTSSTPFNKRGEAIKNPIHFLANIIQKTLAAVSKARSGVKIKLSISKIVLGMPRKLWSATKLYNHMPSWMQAEYIDILNPGGNYAS